MAKALIVGAGINGLSTAWALTKRGWDVEVFEAGPVPNPKAASTDHHRLIRSHYTDPGYAARISEAFSAWDRMFDDLGERPYAPLGILGLSREEGDWTDRCRATMAARGVRSDLLDPDEVAARYPMLETDGVRYGLLTRDGGALMARRILAALAAWLRGAGVVIHEHSPVTEVDPAGSLRSTTGRHHADRIIVTAGIETGAFCPALAPKVHPRRVTVIYALPPDDLREAWEAGPCWIDLGGEDDLWGMPPIAGLPMKLGFGAYTQPGDPATERAVRQADIDAVMGAYQGRFKGIERFTVVEPHVNFYLMAEEERFLMHQEGAALFATADSGHGFKFGALSGEDIAEAADGGNVPAIARRMAGLLQV
ncbi:glycine/D-amino acid oxidase-like deaminating enzyme [Rubricella aquisinus]|uniref:Glycine/D-amino acid oxidase-like deaminating enzyme n=1 Tax=Rubricella aquisinus TaxID=2028108 RepID=A0A840WVR2_9RHOB|nr:FAD-dependent oxidoreductase [Rubricella aquisinus]MBB5515280.1 glycine/D-amino acid oxidase-like deaminating enzyme [Rubricella aquisinus]